MRFHFLLFIVYFDAKDILYSSWFWILNLFVINISILREKKKPYSVEL